MIGVDLHTHSNISDGSYSPEMLVRAAIEKGIHTLALTDHDTMDGLPLAGEIAHNSALKLISGVEISSQWSRPSTKKSYGVHIVALNMQHPAPLEALLIQQKKIRAERAIEICALLEKSTGRDLYAHVLAQVDGHPDRITRSHIAKSMHHLGMVTRTQQAFDQYLKEGKKAYVKFDGPSIAETIDIIHQSQGVAVLAHPTRYGLSATNIRFLIELFAEHGGDAVELPARSEPAGSRQMIDRMVAQFGLKVSVGSDFHGDYMPWIHLGHIPQVKEGQIGIWESF
ncbi:hypothetical protein EC844_12215 [Acinetobacter calcoaceticus]|uniref:Polymerase/histidinol phosphatase N-terminal domain-containing protein n=1 Tax=Acinetobacter calcoaceticus TaxID=471 RepID=A0A4R1XIN5_ACICA|nr:hypothetical protein EC844_12215 [Acinetobacter calcoaceticus]